MAATIPIRIPAMVAPTSGIRSKNAITTPSGTAKGTPRSARTAQVPTPAMSEISRFPTT